MIQDTASVSQLRFIPGEHQTMIFVEVGRELLWIAGIAVLAIGGLAWWKLRSRRRRSV